LFKSSAPPLLIVVALAALKAFAAPPRSVPHQGKRAREHQRSAEPLKRSGRELLKDIRRQPASKRAHAIEDEPDREYPSATKQVGGAIRRMSIEECAEMIERHVEFADKDGHRSVRLPARFVRHCLKTRMR
jgi:hypothetical protein